MKTKILAIALAMVAATVAADAASARDLVRVSDSGQVTVRRNRSVHRYQLPNAIVVDHLVTAGSVYGWAVPYSGHISGYGYSVDW